MDYFAKEKLIRFVKEHECIYDHRHTEYKNNIYKMQLWEHIGNELNVEANEAKQMWRSLRDGYTRHRKQMKGGSGSGRKYTHYMWSSQMTFLDDALDRRLRRGSESPNPTTKVYPESPPRDTPEATWQCNIKPELSRTVSEVVYGTHPSEVSAASLPSESSSLKRISTNVEELQAKHIREDDGIDHLFKSYAASFRRLSLRKQLQLKVTLAKVFAEAEFSEYCSDASAQNTTMRYVSPDEMSDGIKKEEVED